MDNRKWTDDEIRKHKRSGQRPSDSRFMPGVGMVKTRTETINGNPVEYVRSATRSDVLQVVTGNTISNRITFVRGK